MARMKWPRARTWGPTESAFPRGEPRPGPYTHVKPAPVRTLADMTPAERAALAATLTPPGRKRTP